MSSTATKEFIIGIANVEGCQKYTPRAATYNGVEGRIWTKRILENGSWVHQGKQFARSSAADVEVMAAFDSQEVDHDSVDAYWDTK